MTQRIFLRAAEASHSGFSTLARLHDQLLRAPAAPLLLDCQDLTWLDAHLCAPLAAILASAASRLQPVAQFTNLVSEVQLSLTRSGLLPPFGYNIVQDRYHTALPLQRFRNGEVRFYEQAKIWLSHDKLPKMTPKARALLEQSVNELFANVTEHAQSHLGAFTCGQYFPKLNRLKFALSDAGIGIPNRVRSLDRNAGFDDDQALRWVLAGNSTRRDLPGGSGLQVVKAFIHMNGGCLQVVSGRVFYEYHRGGEYTSLLPVGSLGTTIGLEVDTADDAVYCVDGEQTGNGPEV